MKISRRQLKKLINETLILEEPSDYYRDYRAGRITKAEYDEMVRRYESGGQTSRVANVSMATTGTMSPSAEPPVELSPVNKSELKPHKTPNWPHSYPVDKMDLHEELEAAWNAQGPKDGHDPYYFISDSGKIGVYLGPDVRITHISKAQAEEYKSRGGQLIYCQDSRGLDEGNWSVDYIIGRSSQKRDRYYNYAPGSSADRDSY